MYKVSFTNNAQRHIFTEDNNGSISVNQSGIFWIIHGRLKADLPCLEACPLTLIAARQARPVTCARSEAGSELPDT